MAMGLVGGQTAVRGSFVIGIIALSFLLGSKPAAAEEKGKPEPCTEDRHGHYGPDHATHPTASLRSLQRSSVRDHA